MSRELSLSKIQDNLREEKEKLQDLEYKYRYRYNPTNQNNNSLKQEIYNQSQIIKDLEKKLPKTRIIGFDVKTKSKGKHRKRKITKKRKHKKRKTKKRKSKNKRKTKK